MCTRHIEFLAHQKAAEACMVRAEVPKCIDVSDTDTLVKWLQANPGAVSGVEVVAIQEVCEV